MNDDFIDYEEHASPFSCGEDDAQSMIANILFSSSFNSTSLCSFFCPESMTFFRDNQFDL